MFRIQRDEGDGGRAVFRLLGHLGAGELELLLQDVEPCLAAQRAVEVDLVGLRFVDDPCARRLSELGARGVVLSGATGYVRELLSALEDGR